MGHVIVIAVLLLAFFFNVVFFSSPKVLGTIFVSITDLPTFKNKVFSSNIQRILRILLF